MEQYIDILLPYIIGTLPSIAAIITIIAFAIKLTFNFAKLKSAVEQSITKSDIKELLGAIRETNKKLDRHIFLESKVKHDEKSDNPKV